MGLRWDLGQTARLALWDRLDDDEPPRVYLKLHPDDLKALQKELEALLSRNMKGDIAFLDLPTGQVLQIVVSNNWVGKSLIHLGTSIGDL